MSQDNYEQDIESLKNDKWISRLQPLLKSDVSQTRHHFMLSSAFQYILFELEQLNDDEIQNVTMNPSQVEDVAKKWNVSEMAQFIDRVAMVSSTRMLEHIIMIIKKSNISDADKESIIHEIVTQNVTESWDVDEA